MDVKETISGIENQVENNPIIKGNSEIKSIIENNPIGTKLKLGMGIIPVIFKIVGNSGIGIYKNIASGFVSLWTIFIRPFFFSSKKHSIIVPYVYCFIGMGLFIASVILFIRLSWIAALQGIKDAIVVLPTISGVIGILVVMMTFMVKIYNEGKDTIVDPSLPQTPADPSDKPTGVQ